MYIKELHIAAFGPICDKSFKFDRGLNIIEGNNESGKSAIAMFIKFIFYGLSSRATDGAISEKSRYINWSRGLASGYAVCEVADKNTVKTIRIERTMSAKTDADGKTKFSEKVRMLDNATSMPLNISGQPGVFFFGVPESVFMGSAFASQEADIKPDGTSLKEAVENIICAADENINVKKAGDLLDKARIRLLHKNRNGGEIRELERKQNELELRMEDSKDTASRLIKAEISLADVKNNIIASNQRREELEAAGEAIGVLDAEAKILKAEDLKLKLKTAKEKAAIESAARTDDKFMSSLAVAVRDIERGEKQKAELAAAEKSLRECNFSTDRDPEEDAIEARRSDKLASTFFTLGTVLLILGLLAIIVSAAFKFLGNPLFTPALLLTAVVVFAGIIIMISSNVVQRRSYRILDSWGADDCEHMDTIADEIEGKYRNLENARISYATAQSTAQEAEAILESLANQAGLPYDGVPSGVLIKQLVKYGTENSKKKKSYDVEVSNIEGQLSATLASISGTPEEVLAKAAEVKATEIGAIVAAMSTEEKASVTRELNFIRTKIDGLRDRELDLERECATLRATGVSPATDAEELWSIKSKLSKLRREHDALVLAAETLTAAGENIRSSVVPSLTREASRIMASATSGKYSDIGISPAFDMNFRDGTYGTLELDYLSAGTKDMAYIALRLALVKSLYEADARPPVIFDESLAALDESRVANAVRILESDELQTFLFTCRTLEGSLATNAKRITLA